MLDPETHHRRNSLELYEVTRDKVLGSRSTSPDFYWPSKPAAQLRIEEQPMVPRWTTSLSPDSRTEAIARGQRELMEMVRNMPESHYELSLKDLVEHHHRVDTNATREDNTEEEEEEDNKAVVVNKNGKIDRGSFFLKLAFPFFVRSIKEKKKKKKNKKKNESCSSKVSPRPSGGSVKEWWKKSPSAFKESDSGASSSTVHSGSMKSSGESSSSSGCRRSNSRRSNSRREKGGGRCWPFIRTKK